MAFINPKNLKLRLEELYQFYNKREFVHPDPLEFLYHYENLKDREIVGLIASALAFGNVTQILKSIEKVLNKMGPSPKCFIQEGTFPLFKKTFKDFKHRWFTGEDFSYLLLGIKGILEKHGSLHGCFLQGLKKEDQNILPALTFLIEELEQAHSKRMRRGLLPIPDKGSACKRHHLFLRWMIRQDAIDPGGWSDIPLNKLLIPVDTHMHRIGKLLKFTKNNQANQKAAYEITESFKKLIPEDPVKYDFALTRLGIRETGTLKSGLQIWGLL